MPGRRCCPASRRRRASCSSECKMHACRCSSHRQPSRRFSRGAVGARAETLEEALVAAYDTNPQILAERANVQRHGRRRAAGLGRLAADRAVHRLGRLGAVREHAAGAAERARARDGSSRKTVDVNMTQPIYQGGRTVAKTAAAEQTVEAERARYAATEEHDLLQRRPVLFRRAARPGDGRSQHQQRAGAAPPARGDAATSSASAR